MWKTSCLKSMCEHALGTCAMLVYVHAKCVECEKGWGYTSSSQDDTLYQGAVPVATSLPVVILWKLPVLFYVFTYLSIYLSIQLSTHPLTHPSIHPFTNLCICKNNMSLLHLAEDSETSHCTGSRSQSDRTRRVNRDLVENVCVSLQETICVC